MKKGTTTAAATTTTTTTTSTTTTAISPTVVYDNVPFIRRNRMKDILS